MSILVAVSDLHVNGTPALCPPIFERDGTGAYYPNKSQEWLWDCWLDFWTRVYRIKKRTNQKVIVVLVGDLVDINKHSKYQLISPNPSEILDATETVLLPALDTADSIYVIRGTEAHTGGVSWLEEQLAKNIGAESDEVAGTHSWYWLPLQVEGTRFGFAHHPGTNSTRPWTRGNAANRAAAMVMDAYYSDDERPDVAVFGHVHHDEDSYDNHPVRAMFLTPWALHTAFDARCGRAFTTPQVGGNIFVIHENDYDLHKIRYKPERRGFQRA
jgi:hypothetical protein